jgi:hypothetical protein
MAARPAEGIHAMTEADRIVDRYIAAWNETDAGLRGSLLAEVWGDDASYVDPMSAAQGREQFSAVIGAIHQAYPGFRFALSGRIDGYGDHVRFSWTLGPASQPDVIQGTDFAVVSDGRLMSVVGFFDRVPQGD